MVLLPRGLISEPLLCYEFFFFLIQAHSTHIPIHHDPLFSLLIHRRAYKNVLQSHKVETTLQWALH